MSIHTLRRRFVKDQGAPIQLLRSPYFEYLLALYNDVYQTEKKYELFLNEVEKFGGEDNFLTMYNKIKDEIIQHVEGKKSYQQFNQDLLKQFDAKDATKKSDLYQPENHEKQFMSVDLKKANFHVLRYYDEEIVDKQTSYESWLNQFVDSEYLATSKYFRQVIFGNLNPKKQVKIQKYITHQLKKTLEDQFGFTDVKNASHDEIVVSVEENVDTSHIKKTLEGLFENKIPIHVDVFTLFAQHPTKELGYVKEYRDKEKIEFKSLNGIFMPQAYKTYFGLEIHENDLMFHHEGYVAKLTETVAEKESIKR